LFLWRRNDMNGAPGPTPKALTWGRLLETSSCRRHAMKVAQHAVLGSKLHLQLKSRRDDRTHPPRASAEAPTNSTPNAPPNSNASSGGECGTSERFQAAGVFAVDFPPGPSARTFNLASGTEHSAKPQFKQIKSCGNTITCGLRRASSPPGK